MDGKQKETWCIRNVWNNSATGLFWNQLNEQFNLQIRQGRTIATTLFFFWQAWFKVKEKNSVRFYVSEHHACEMNSLIQTFWCTDSERPEIQVSGFQLKRTQIKNAYYQLK